MLINTDIIFLFEFLFIINVINFIMPVLVFQIIPYSIFWFYFDKIDIDLQHFYFVVYFRLKITYVKAAVKAKVRIRTAKQEI